MKKIKQFVKKNKKIHLLLINLRTYLKGTYYKTILHIFKIFPIEKNKIFISNYVSKGYGDQSKYIVEELLKDNNKYKIYWTSSPKYKSTFPEKITYVKYNSISSLYHMATAKIWLNNCRFPYGIVKRKNQFYIQTWHSSLRLKKIEKDAEKYMPSDYIKAAKNDSKMIDIIISGSGFSSKIYKDAFWYNGKIIEIGTPRCDIFFDDKKKKIIKEKVYKRYNIEPKKKIILYAPTFRSEGTEKENYLNCSNFSKKINEDYILLVRFHPVTKLKIKNEQNLIDVTEYEDMQELIIASNILITDYSGCCFDALINNTTCFLYTPDINEYLKKERDLYFDIDSLPFEHAYTEEELLTKIQNYNKNEYTKKIDEFKSQIKLCENGNSSKEIATIIKKVVQEEKND